MSQRSRLNLTSSKVSNTRHIGIRDTKNNFKGHNLSFRSKCQYLWYTFFGRLLEVSFVNLSKIDETLWNDLKFDPT